MALRCSVLAYAAHSFKDKYKQPTENRQLHETILFLVRLTCISLGFVPPWGMGYTLIQFYISSCSRTQIVNSHL